MELGVRGSEDAGRIDYRGFSLPLWFLISVFLGGGVGFFWLLLFCCCFYLGTKDGAQALHMLHSHSGTSGFIRLTCVDVGSKLM